MIVEIVLDDGILEPFLNPSDKIYLLIASAANSLFEVNFLTFEEGFV